MRRLSCGEGDISAKGSNICSLLGSRFSVMIGLRALCADGKAKSARTEDAGFLDLLVVIKPRIVLGCGKIQVSSCRDVCTAVCDDICRLELCIFCCGDMDVLSGDIGRECRTLLAVGTDGGGLAGEQAALFVPHGVVVFGTFLS